MNDVEKLAEMLNPGGKARLAEISEVSQSLVTRWIKRGWISAGHNVRLKRGLAEYAETHGMGKEWLLKATALLTVDRCPTCGRELE